jgi:hypothetical protein
MAISCFVGSSEPTSVRSEDLDTTKCGSVAHCRRLAHVSFHRKTIQEREVSSLNKRLSKLNFLLLVSAVLITTLMACESEAEIQLRKQERLSSQQDSIRTEFHTRASLFASDFIEKYTRNLELESETDELWGMLSTKSTLNLPIKSMRAFGFMVFRIAWHSDRGLGKIGAEARESDIDGGVRIDSAWVTVDSTMNTSDSLNSVAVWYTVHSIWGETRLDPYYGNLLIVKEQDSMKILINDIANWTGL